MTTKSKISYQGREVFIGIDVHRRTYHVTALCEKVPVWRATLPAEVELFVSEVGRRFSGAVVHTVYEAGFSGFGLHRGLEAAGYRSMVVNAASVAVQANSRVKTDKRDSLRLSIELADGRLLGVRIPTEAEERRRVINRTREQLTEHRTAIMNQIRMKLLQFGFISLQFTGRLTLGQVKNWRENAPWSPELCSAIDALCGVWEQVNKEIKTLEKALKAQAKKDGNHEIYRSLPGIGLLGARVLSNELGDLSQFKNERTMYSFAGFTPSEHSSGDAVRRGHITRQGSGRIRKILTEAAWAALRKDLGLRRVFERIARRAGKKRAIVAIARKLLGRARRLLSTGELYCFETSLQVAAIG